MPPRSLYILPRTVCYLAWLPSERERERETLSRARHYEALSLAEICFSAWLMTQKRPERCVPAALPPPPPPRLPRGIGGVEVGGGGGGEEIEVTICNHLSVDPESVMCEFVSCGLLAIRVEGDGIPGVYNVPCAYRAHTCSHVWAHILFAALAH